VQTGAQAEAPIICKNRGRQGLKVPIMSTEPFAVKARFSLKVPMDSSGISGKFVVFVNEKWSLKIWVVEDQKRQQKMFRHLFHWNPILNIP
jgi:hypothetical protein